MIDTVSRAGSPPAAATAAPAVLELRGLAVEYRLGDRCARAVDGVDLQIEAGEIVGLAGESGCGKSTIANAVMQILRPPAYLAGGSILFQGEDLSCSSSSASTAAVSAPTRTSSRVGCASE